MSEPVGHPRCRAALEAELPVQPVLLLGPESTGKWVLANWLACYHAQWYDQFVQDRPTIDKIRELRSYLATPPKDSTHKVAAINLDGARSPGVQHALLKELEEPPPYARYLLVASRSPLPTISSRCVIWRLGDLSDDEVASVLERVKGMSAKDAQALAPAGRGRVAPALAAADRFRPAKAAVLGAVRAISARDRDALERVAKDWGDTEDWLLRELFGTAASGRPSALFSSTERALIGRSAARRGIALLAASGRARPQVSVRALAGALMSDERQ